MALLPLSRSSKKSNWKNRCRDPALPYRFIRCVSVAVCRRRGGDLHASSAVHEVMVPDLHGDSPPCAVSLPANQEQCTPEGCTLPLPKRSTLKSLQIKFSCLPLGTLTGFERPAPGARIRGVRARNAMASVLLVDDLESAPEERKREMIFCIYGTQMSFAAMPTFCD